ncbi:hypothetical protein MMC26_004086 [Xylographa opegraphella]|nr:hypothetical protein [Xylographa opegraphella]
MSRNSSEFAETSVVDVLIPEASSVDIEEALASSETTRDEDDTALITSVPQRSLLFFDEKLSIYVVLRTPYQNEAQLKGYISRLQIVLEAHATTSAPRTGDSHQGQTMNQLRDVIWSGKVNVLEDPIIVVEESDDIDDGQAVLVIWRLTAFLGEFPGFSCNMTAPDHVEARPRIRIQSPAIMFKISASLQPQTTGNSPQEYDPYLPSGVPFPINLLQPLQDDPALNGSASRLSAFQLSQKSVISPTTPLETLPLRTISKKAIRTIPAISARIRYHKSSDTLSKSTIIASLDIEIPVFANNDVDLQSVNVHLNEGEAEDLIREHILKLPVKCRPKDNIGFLYRLTFPDVDNDRGSSALSATVLEVSIDGEVQVSTICHPKIHMRWRANVDTSTALNPNFGRPGQSMQRNHRPISLPAPAASIPKANIPTDSGIDVGKDSTEGSGRTSTTIADIGITATFTATEDVYVGEPFTWDIFIVNRSTKSRRLAIFVLPKLKRSEGKKVGSRPSSSSSNQGSRSGSVADAVVDENVLHAVMKTQSTEGVQLVCLTTEIKIGPLSPGSCYVTEVKFLPLARGFLHVETARIVDLSTNESMDIRDLPDIHALSRVPDE